MKIRNISYFFIALTLIFSVVSCTDEFEEINTNPTNPAEVPSGFLFSNVQWLVNQQGFWVYSVLHIGNWVQHYGNQNKGFTMAHYTDRGQDMAGFWNNHYLNLSDLERAKEQVAKQDEGEVAAVKLALIEIQAVEIWYYFTQMVGDVPYSEALKGVENVAPAYDTQESIISDLFTRLDAAISTLKSSTIPAMGAADAFYASDPQQWVKYGNSLMLKMGHGIEKGNASLAEQMVTKAMAGPLLESNDDNAILPTDNGGPAYRHPSWSLDNLGTSDRPFLGETFVNTLINTNDPRLPVVASPTARSVNAGGALEYRGIPAAPDDGIYADVNANLDDYSFPNADWMSGATTSYNKGINRMTYASVCFGKAEAALKGWGANPGDAQGFFEEGIRAAMSAAPFSDAGVTTEQIDDYIAANGTLTGSTAEQWNQVITQNWIQNFMDQEFDAYLDWRRTGFPTLVPGPNPGETGNTIPRRYKYSENEVVLNEANYNAAVGRLSNGDSYTSRVWSDQ